MEAVLSPPSVPSPASVSSSDSSDSIVEENENLRIENIRMLYELNTVKRDKEKLLKKTQELEAVARKH